MAVTSNRGAMPRATRLVRLAVVTAMGAVTAVIAGGIFDQVRSVLVLAPLAAGATVAATDGARARWRTVWLAVVAAATTLLLVLVEGGDVGDGPAALVQGPRRLLTTEWPSPVDPVVVGFVGLVLFVATVLAALLAGSRRWRLAPLAPITLATVTVVALAAPRPPLWSTLGLLGVGALVLGLLPADEPLRPRVATLLGDRTVGVTASAVLVVALGASAVVASSDRADPRRVEDADLTATVLDSLEATVALRRADPVLDLYGITDRSPLVGRAVPSRWRLTALDVYDGQRWVPQVVLRPIGTRLGAAPELEPGDPPPITYEVVFRTDDLDLVPFPGRPLAVDAPVETDLDRVAVRLAERPEPGTSVTATSLVAPVLADAVAEDGALVERRAVDEIAQIFTERARELAGDGEPIEQLRSIESAMRSEWILDRAAPGGGQQLALLQRFVDETRRGTREQFVTAFVLLARSLGVDARVATGFVVPPEELASPLVLRSTHASSWPEVRITDGEAQPVPGGRWLAFDPVPVREEQVEDEPPQPPDAQSPAAAQPPIQPPADEADDEQDRTTETVTDRGRWEIVVEWAVRVAAVTSIGLLPLVLFAGTVLVLKWRRRRHRRRLADPARRVRGAWADVTDGLVDAGLVVAPAWTDDGIAVAGTSLAPSAPHELRRLASMATAVTFGPPENASRFVDDAVVTGRSIELALRAERSRWQRVRWRLSLRSLRRRTRSPIVV